MRDGRTLAARRRPRAAAGRDRSHRRKPRRAAGAGRGPRRCGSPSSDPTTTAMAGSSPSPSAGEAEQSLQQALLAQGAGAGRRPGSATRPARTNCWRPSGRPAPARRGLWADPNFAPLPAENSMRLRDERGHFALVEGKVLSVHQSGGTIYVNFGRRWTRGFQRHHSAAQCSAFAAAGLELKQLEGRRVLVRGWLEQRARPGHRGRCARADRARSTRAAAH